MRRWVSLVMVLAMFTILSIGCAGVSKDAKIKCPKCGAVFTVEEGLQEIRKMGAP